VHLQTSDRQAPGFTRSSYLPALPLRTTGRRSGPRAGRCGGGPCLRGIRRLKAVRTIVLTSWARSRWATSTAVIVSITTRSIDAEATTRRCSLRRYSCRLPSADHPPRQDVAGGILILRFPKEPLSKLTAHRLQPRLRGQHNPKQVCAPSTPHRFAHVGAAPKASRSSRRNRESALS